jgi:hypothetical protein
MSFVDLIDMQDLIALSSNSQTSIRFGIRRLPSNNDFRPILKEIKSRMAEFHIIVYSSLHAAGGLLQQASRLSMVTNYYHYIFAHLVYGSL